MNKRPYNTEKTDMILIRLHPDEKAKIAKLAKEAGLNLSEYMRKTALKAKKRKSA